MTAFPSFIGGAYVTRSPVSDQEETINFYQELMESAGATAKASLYPTPGVEPFVTVAATGGRAMFTGTTANTERSFGVIGGVLYEFFAGGTALQRGVVAIDGNPATISTNGDGGGQLFITSGGHGYCYDLATNVLTQVLTGDATQGGELYGYFVAFDVKTSTIRISDLFDGLTWDPTQFAQRTIGSDPWRAMLVTPYGQILLPGIQSGEFWYNKGTFPFPFAPDPSGLFAYGAASTFSIQHSGTSPVWLGGTEEGGYTVLAAQGYAPERISNHALEEAMRGYPRVDDAIGQVYSEEGHRFYLLTFPTANVTWGYDFSSPQFGWSKRGTWIAETATYQYWRPVYHCFAFGIHLMADAQTGTVYHMANDLPFDVDGRVIRRMRRAPVILAENLTLIHRWFELLMQTGVGLVLGQGSTPIVMLRYSDDSGQTWSSEITASAGAIGEFSTRVYWNALGAARQRIYEVTVSDPVPWRITAAFLRTVKGNEVAA